MTDPPRCSFCGKTQAQARKLIAGPGVYICEDCVELCAAIIREEFESDPPASPEASA